MVLNNIVNKKKENGFTLVELLIVIVIIAILAAITIVAYSGITARANSSKAQANAESAQKVAESMNADNGYYPALAAGTTGTDTTPTTTGTGFTIGSKTTKLPSGMTVIPDAATTTINGTNGTNTVGYRCLTSCTSATGGAIGYWNFVSGAENFAYIGNASGTLTTPSGTYVYPAS